MASPVVGYYLDRMQRAKVLQIGLIVLGLCMVGFGLAVQIQDQTTYIVVILVLRALHGSISAMNDTVILSITGLLYKHHQDIVIAIILVTSGLGFTLAPLIGSILYQTIG